MTANVAFAVIRLSRNCRALEPALAASLSDIDGVSQVHVDSRRSVVHVLYDGRIDAAEHVHRFLVATGWARKETASFNRLRREGRGGNDMVAAIPATPEHHP